MDILFDLSSGTKVGKFINVVFSLEDIFWLQISVDHWWILVVAVLEAITDVFHDLKNLIIAIRDVFRYSVLDLLHKIASFAVFKDKQKVI